MRRSSGVKPKPRRAISNGLSAEILLAHLDGRCAKYRWPRQFYFWDSLPKSGYGKVTKKDIRARLIERGDLKPVAS